MWYRVLAARYSEVDGRLEVGGRSGSLWWKEVACIRDGLGDVGGAWFTDNIVRKVGNGENTLFWSDHWVGSSPLCAVQSSLRFSRA